MYVEWMLTNMWLLEKKWWTEDEADDYGGIKCQWMDQFFGIFLQTRRRLVIGYKASRELLLIEGTARQQSPVGRALGALEYHLSPNCNWYLDGHSICIFPFLNTFGNSFLTSEWQGFFSYNAKWVFFDPMWKKF